MTTLRRFYYSFPIRLVALHFRNHMIMIGVWMLLTLLMTGLLGRFFGFHYLLLTPEYRGRVDFWSFFITGAAFGIFFLIWNLTSYLLSAYRFAFLATLKAPFTKFCLNNSVIPLAFLLTYLFSTIWFQWHDELTHSVEIALNIMGFLGGMVAMISVVSFYLYHTNKDIVSFLGADKLVPLPGDRRLAGKRVPTLNDIRAGINGWRVDTYLTETLRLRRVRSVAHYNQAMLARVFRQNHSNAVLVQMAVFALLMVQGLFMDSAWARIPTGASIFFLACIVLSLFGFISFWFSQWGTLVFLLLLVAINFITGLGFFNYRNQAYGLDYSPERRATYTQAALDDIYRPENVEHDKAQALAILEKWRARNHTAGGKPKMVFLCVSGGGMRSALWTMQTLQQADQATGGQLLRQSMLITGASGGMLGAAYLREVYLREQQGAPLSIYDTTLLTDVGNDLLNPVSFGIVSNDLFFPLSTFRSGNFTYRKDRGYLLEGQLNANYRGLFGKRTADYRQPEADALIPMMVLSPFILNDARRLLISPHGMSYLMAPPDKPQASLHPEIDAVDFGRLFAAQEADSLAFTSALRMNCTYPFILPNVWLPTAPALEVMDAGFRDNYGVSLAARFIHVFRDWIQENTGGVVIVQIRCWEKIDPIAAYDTKGVVENLLSPGTVMGNLTSMQDFEHDNTLALLQDLLGERRLDVIRFIYQPVRKENEASLSLHLSTREKLDLLDAFGLPENQASLAALKQILK
jgi:hypothetical protein